jgi:SAM-dependent methyltransferase
MATELGITGNGPDDLSRFDAYFFRTYPYLQPFLGRAPVAGRRVLEIGLGYGTVGQRLAEQGARYTGMDIAAGPVAMMRHRLDLAELSGDAVQASALDLPFPSESLEVVVAIGCLHHTGDFPRAIREVHRVLVPGGHALVMVYNRFSYDQWLHWPLRTLRAWRRDRGWEAPEVEPSSEAQRRQYDFNRSGEAAPVTDFFSVTQAQEIFRDFSALHWQRENCHSPLWVPKIRHHVRRWMLPFMGGLGLDLYIHATK